MVSISESGWSGWFRGNGMDGCVMEVTEMSGSEVMGRVWRLWRYTEVMERCMEGMEICGGYRDLVGGVVMQSKELY